MTCILGIGLLSALLLISAAQGFGATKKEEKSIKKPVNRQVDGALKPSSPWTFIVYGDTQSYHGNHAIVAKKIAEKNPYLVLHMGDLAGGCRIEAWKRFLKAGYPILSRIPFYPAWGNHDAHCKLMEDIFDLPGNKHYYSFDVGDVHFVVLDSYHHYQKQSPQWEWVNEDLKKNRLPFTLLFYHHPIRTTGSKVVFNVLKKSIDPILAAYRIDAIFNGHFHYYERQEENGVVTIITGGGGGKLQKSYRTAPYSKAKASTHHYCVITVYSDRLEGEVWDLEDKVIDRFVVPKR